MGQSNMPRLFQPQAWMQAFLRFFFKHLYTTLAWSYDFVAFVTSAGQWRSWQMAGVERLIPGRVLEIGFGTGHMLSVLAGRGYDVFGIDPSRKMSQIASRRLEKNALLAQLVSAEAQSLPFNNNEFHSILSTFPSEYIFNQTTLNEAWRVLKPEGVLVIIPGVETIFGIKSKEKWILALLDEIVSLLYRITGEAIDPNTNIAEEFMKRLSYSGFSVEIQHAQQTRAVVLRIIAKKKA